MNYYIHYTLSKLFWKASIFSYYRSRLRARLLKGTPRLRRSVLGFVVLPMASLHSAARLAQFVCFAYSLRCCKKVLCACGASCFNFIVLPMVLLRKTAGPEHRSRLRARLLLNHSFNSHNTNNC